jgi:DNA-binding Lrp family transcriptional regulator
MAKPGEENVKDTELRLISELMKNSRRSDRELGKALGVSQPTVSRRIKKLEKEGIIKEYTMVPDLQKLGVEIIAFTFGVWSPEKLKDSPENKCIEKAKKFISERPNVIFASSGHGLGMERIIITVHKDYSDYDEFMKQVEIEWAGLLTKFESFTLSVRTAAITMPFSLGNLMEYIRKRK